MKIIPVQTAGPAEREQVVDTMVRAFADDPAARWMYPHPDDYVRHFPAFVEAFAGRAFADGMVHRAGGMRGAALWLAPGTHPDEDAVVNLISRSVAMADQPAMFEVFEAMGSYHPAGPHWHLPMIGVEPAEQGKGYGSALLHHAVMRCDAEELPAYLESSNARNIPLYRRYGFEVLGTIQAGTSPPITPMLRRPR